MEALRKLQRPCTEANRLSVTHSTAQDELGVRLLEIDGRKARLTEVGQVLLDRSRHLVISATELEQLARHMEQGWEAEVRLTVDAAFPMSRIFAALKQFYQQAKNTRVTLSEVILSGAKEALKENSADLVIGVNLTEDYLAEHLLDIELIAVAHPTHPLHHQSQQLTSKHLNSELQIIIRDSGHSETQTVGWQNTEQRWVVSHIDTAIESISQGLGFGWLPAHKITHKIKEGILKPLPLREGASYYGAHSMAYGQPEQPGPATQLLAEKIREHCRLPE